MFKYSAEAAAET
jgi:predicted phage gp36 major capsid-like protein